MQNNDAFAGVTVAQMRNKQGAKWQRYGDDVVPSFVADMDFPLAQPIHDVLREQLTVHDYGYTLQFDEHPLREIFAAWAQRRFNWQVDPGSIEALVDIVQGIYLSIQLYTEPGDGVMTLTPTYPPLWHSVESMGRRLVDCTLLPSKGGYEIDFDQLEDQLDPTVKLLLLCNPHNPTGRVFTRSELERLAALVVERDLIVVSDEIHADLVYAPHRHIPFASLGPEIEQRTITMTSATKSFNLGGLRFAIAIFGSQALQNRFNSLPKGARGGLNSLGVLATEVAWRDCDDWLDGLVGYLQDNRDFVYEQLRTRVPQLDMHKPESTYLAWLGCQQLPINRDPFEHFLEVGKVAFNSGLDFGSGGDGFVRLNFATSRRILTEIIDRAVSSLPRG
jgi:cystathionine beta-lyase